MKQLNEKQFSLEVTCICEDGTDCEYMLVDIDNELREYVIAMNQQAVDLDCYCMKKFYGEYRWYNDDGDIYRIDSPMLVVTQYQVYFEAYPKHCGDDMMLCSEAMDLQLFK